MGALIKGDGLKRWALYLVKAAVLFGLLGLFCWKVTALPAPAVALVWAVLTAASTVGLMYHAVVRKAARQNVFEEGGTLSNLNEGRLCRLVAYFIVSAATSGAFIIEAVRWSWASWVLVAVGALVFIGVYQLVDSKVQREAKPVVHVQATTMATCGITGILMLGGYAAMLIFLPSEHYLSLGEAVAAMVQTFDGASSTLVNQAGTLAGLYEGAVAFLLSATGDSVKGAYVAGALAMGAATFFTVSNLLGTCSLPMAELKRVILPLGAFAGDPAPKFRPIKKVVATCSVLPVLLLAGFIAADCQVAKVCEGQEVAPAQSVVQRALGIAAYALGDYYYDKGQVDALLEEAGAQSQTLSQQAQEALEPLINQLCDARVANVDSYLDWYYSLTGDYEQLASMVTGTAEEFATQQFANYIDANVDTTQLEDTLSSYCTQAEELNDSVASQLEGCQLADVPSWMVGSVETLTTDAFSLKMESTDKLLEWGTRMGVSTASGVAAGVAVKAATNAATKAGETAADEAGKKVAEKAAEKVAEEVVEETGEKAVKEGTEKAAKTLVSKVTGKEFFKVLVEKLGSKLGSKAVGSAVGGAVGTVAGPVGTAVGVVAGAAVSVGVDTLLVKADEAMNRETYKQEIVDSIEEDRSEMLASIGVSE